MVDREEYAQYWHWRERALKAEAELENSRRALSISESHVGELNECLDTANTMLEHYQANITIIEEVGWTACINMLRAYETIDEIADERGQLRKICQVLGYDHDRWRRGRTLENEASDDRSMRGKNEMP